MELSGRYVGCDGVNKRRDIRSPCSFKATFRWRWAGGEVKARDLSPGEY